MAKFDIQGYLSKLDTDEENKRFIGERLKKYDNIELELAEVIKMLRAAKQSDIEHYQTSPDYSITYATDLIIDYLNDIKKTLKG